VLILPTNCLLESDKSTGPGSRNAEGLLLFNPIVKLLEPAGVILKTINLFHEGLAILFLGPLTREEWEDPDLWKSEVGRKGG
jgi:hypothetical protein